MRIRTVFAGDAPDAFFVAQRSRNERVIVRCRGVRGRAAGGSAETRARARLQHGSGAWTRARACNTPYRNELIIRAIVTRPRTVHAASLPNTAGGVALPDLLAGECHRVRPIARAAAAFDFKTKTILQPMFTLAFSQAAQRAVSKCSTCVIAPINQTPSAV